MTRTIKLAAIAAFAAAGSATAFAQQSNAEAPRPAPPAEHQAHMMGEGSQMGHGMMGGMMMNGPEMRSQMVQMMKNCSHMMERRSDGQKPNG